MCGRRRAGAQVVKTRLHRDEPLPSSLFRLVPTLFPFQTPPSDQPPPFGLVSQRRRLRRPRRPWSVVKLPHETFLMSNGGGPPSLFAVSTLPLPPAISSPRPFAVSFTSTLALQRRLPRGEPFLLFLPFLPSVSVYSVVLPCFSPPFPPFSPRQPYLSISWYRGVFSKGRLFLSIFLSPFLPLPISLFLSFSPSAFLSFSPSHSHFPSPFSSPRDSSFTVNDHVGRRGAIARGRVECRITSGHGAINARIMLNIARLSAFPTTTRVHSFPGPHPSCRTAPGTRRGTPMTLPLPVMATPIRRIA